jgi:hypothetical protein
VIKTATTRWATASRPAMANSRGGSPATPKAGEISQKETGSLETASSSEESSNSRSQHVAEGPAAISPCCALALKAVAARGIPTSERNVVDGTPGQPPVTEKIRPWPRGTTGNSRVRPISGR